MKHKRKLLLSVILTFAVVAGILFPLMTAHAADDVYTVTLSPGDGTGDPITFRSNEGTIAANWRSAGNCQFYYENNGAMGFNLRDNFCPDSFSAPEGYTFNGWKDNAGYNTLTSKATTFTAKWRVTGEAKITVTPTELTFTPDDFDADGYAPVIIEITELDFGPNAGGDPRIQLEFPEAKFFGEGRSNRLSFEPYSTDHMSGGHSLTTDTIRKTGSYSFVLHINPEDLAAKAPGTYKCSWEYDIDWTDIGGSDAPQYGIIELTLTIPEDSVIPGSGTGEGGLVHRMYNPNSGEHFYTVSDEERDNLISLGWNYESECSFTAPAPSDDTLPVYRLYNPSGDEHRFTTDTTEVETLYNDFGWNYEGISFCVYRNDSGNGVPVYRALNPNNGYYNFTTGKYEQDYIVGLGWVDEGVVWRVEK